MRRVFGQSAPVSVMDALLVLLVIVWGMNYSLMKRAFEEVPFMAFNALRFGLASAVFLAGIAVARRRAHEAPGTLDPVFYTRTPPTGRDWFDFAWLGLVGHCGYQLCWTRALTVTSASNGALIIGAAPVAVATLSALLGHERITRTHWMGVALSLLGIYFVVGRGADTPGGSLTGDLLMFAAVGCWAVYTLGGSRLMSRHSPLYVAGITTTIGTLGYALLAVPSFGRVEWTSVSVTVWGLLVFSALFAVNIANVVWYAAVKRLGAARTAMYANVIPLVAMAIAVIWLSEPVTRWNLFGAAAVLAGVLLTRLARPPSDTTPPVEE
jgi:drug/metabolite transporter (DMT)-like permease